MTDEIQIIIPAGADLTKALDHGLVALTEAICQVTGEESGYGLGGRFGYGENFENDVFVMRRFYWGDCDCGADDREEEWCSKNFHKPECYYSELQREKKAAGLSYVDTMKNKYIHVDGGSYEKNQKIEDEIYTRLCAKHGLDRKFGCAVHCTCDHEKAWSAWIAENGHRPTCSLELPNFLHKPTGLEVRWYKWIGRGMEVKGADGVDLQSVFSGCLSSLNTATAHET